jgi:hypothetical protein
MSQRDNIGDRIYEHALVDVDNDNHDDAESLNTSSTLIFPSTSCASSAGTPDKSLRIKISKISGDGTGIPSPPLPPPPPAPPPLLAPDFFSQLYGSSGLNGGSRTSAPADQTADEPFFGCHFFFLGCQYSSCNRATWKTHCLGHFGSIAPPTTATCLLCSAEFVHASGAVAWDNMLEHMADHLLDGDSTAPARPDFKLLKYLWQKHAITTVDYQELQMKFPVNEKPPYPVISTGNTRTEVQTSSNVQSQGSKRTPEGKVSFDTFSVGICCPRCKFYSE